MRKLLAVMLVLVTVFLAVPVSAAEKDVEDIIYDEIIQAVDIKNYPALSTDSEIYLLRLMETGYGENGFESGNALYLYLYNPSCKEITASELNSVQMATAWDDEGMPTDFKKYGLTIEGSALNGLYIRAKVNVSAKTVATLVNGTRRYGITEFELHENGKYNAKAYKEGFIYEFSGYGDSLKCTKTDFLTLTLDVHQTSYLLGDEENADTFTYRNQLNSVYFSIPEEVEEKYGLLYSVKYEYYQVYTNPIFVTNEEYLSMRLAMNRIFDDSIADLYLCTYAIGNSDNPDMVDLWYPVGDASDYESPHYYAGTEISVFKNKIVNFEGLFYEPTVFYLVDEIIDDEVLVTAEELQESFLNYTKEYSTNSGLVRGKYSWDLFDRREGYSTPIHVVEERTRDELFDFGDVSADKSWWEILFGLENEGIEDVSYIEPVTYSMTQQDDFSETYLVCEADVDKLANFCQSADIGDDSVYLLRYASADNYRYANMFFDAGEVDIASDAMIYWVQENVYLDFDIIQLAFGNSPEDLTVFGVVSSPTDGFAAIQVGGSGNKDEEYDWMALMRKILAIVMIFVAVLVIVWLIGKLGEIGQAKTNREIRKYLKNQNKNQNRRK